MKKLTFLTILAALAVVFSFGKLSAQVNIGADVAPKSFSVLELQGQYEDGIYGGLRLPQLTTAQRNAITGLNIPEAVGLTIFNTTDNRIEFWDGADWKSVGSDVPQFTTTQRNAMSVGWNNSNSGFMIFNTTTNRIEFWNGTEWKSLGGDIQLPVVSPEERDAMSVGWSISNSGFMIFNTFCACIEYWNGLRWNRLYFDGHLPMYNTFDRDAFTPEGDDRYRYRGFTIFNVTTACIEYWNGTAWISLCDVRAPQLTETERNSIVGLTAPEARGIIIFNLSSGSLEYWNGNKWIELGESTGPSDPSVWNGQECGAYIAPGVWKKFLCRNLGAASSADPYTPSADVMGDYYRWGDSTPVATFKTILIPLPWSYSDGWYGNNSTDPNTKVKSSYDPCPEGYRVPNIAEWEGLFANNTITFISAGQYPLSESGQYHGCMIGDYLMLPGAGRRTIEDEGYNLHAWRGDGRYWTSQREATLCTPPRFCAAYAFLMHYATTTTGIWMVDLDAHSIRCIAED